MLLAVLAAGCGMEDSSPEPRVDIPEELRAEHRRVRDMLFNQPDSARAAALVMVERAEASSDRVARALALRTLSRTYSVLGKGDSARSTGMEALRQTREIGDERHLVDALVTRSWSMYDDNQFDSARILLNEALVHATGYGSAKDLAMTYDMRGTVNSAQGDFRSAVRDYLHAASYLDSIDTTANLATVLANIGNEYGRVKDFDRARSYQQRAVALNEHTGQRVALAGDLANLGTTLIELQDYAEAEAVLRRSIDLATEIGATMIVAQGLHNRGEIALRTGAPDSARRLFTESLRLARSLDDTYGIMIGLVSLAECDLNARSYASAIRLLHDARGLAETMNDVEYQGVIDKMLGDAYLRTGEARSAADAYTRVLVLRDSLYARVSADALAFVEAEFQLERQQEQVENLQHSDALNQLVIQRQQLVMAVIALTVLLVIGYLLFRRRAQRIQREHRQLLAQQERERERLEHHDELQRAFDAQTQAMRARDVFMQTISHELRTPLTGILGMTDVLHMQQDGLTDKQRRYVEVIAASGQRLHELIVNLLDVAGVEHAEFRIHPVDTKLEVLVAASLLDMHAHARNKGLEITSTIHPERITLSADPARLRQALTHLLSNAVKFTPAYGRIALTVAQQNDTVRISVQDSGIGIAPEDHERIFLPFVQVDARIERTAEGAGVGLPLVKRIVELHGGEIRLDSQPGQGSTFTIILPLQFSA